MYSLRKVSEMKNLLVLFSLLVAAQAFLVQVPKARFASVNLLHFQKLTIELYSDDATSNTDFIQIANDFEFRFDPNNYRRPEVAQEFWNLKEDITGEGVMLRAFTMLYNAKDVEIFYQTAIWIRLNMSRNIFNYAFTSILFRKDLGRIALPPLFEIYPNDFITEDVIDLVQRIVNSDAGSISSLINDPNINVIGSTYVIDAKYTTPYEAARGRESQLAYFMEDIALNSYYAYQQILNPYQIQDSNINKNYGESWYFLHKQLLARYYMERLTNGLGEIPEFSWDSVIATGYDPKLINENGEKYLTRTDNYNVNDDSDIELVSFLKSFEDTIMAEIQKESVDQTTPNAKVTLDVLIRLIKSTTFSNSYESIARYVLGASRLTTASKIHYMSALEKDTTALRDPMFWQLYKRILKIADTLKDQLPPYSVTDLTAPGVIVNDVQVSKLQTYVDYYNFDITSVLKLTDESVSSGPIKVKERLQVLNHKPFTFKINVSSTTDVRTTVKIFIAPKVDSRGVILNLNANRHNFFLLDRFDYTLRYGINRIVRSSTQFNNVAEDLPTSSDLLAKVQNAVLGIEPYYLFNNNTQSGFPSRLQIPRGTQQGYPLQLFIMVMPQVSSTSEPEVAEAFQDRLLFGFPFDRPIDETTFYQPNMLVSEILVNQKGEFSSTKVTSPGTYDYASKKGGKTYDYKGKQDYQGKQNFKKFDYQAKKLENQAKMSTTSELPTETIPTDTIPNENIPTENIPTENIPTENISTENITTETIPAETTVTADDITLDVVSVEPVYTTQDEIYVQTTTTEDDVVSTKETAVSDDDSSSKV